MKRFLVLNLVVLVLLSSLGGIVFAQDVPLGGTVRIAGDWGTLTNNFNPFLAGGQNAPGTFSALYESMFFVNTLTGDVEPVLGTDFAWGEGNLSLTMTLREGVNWSDGTKLTIDDVIFTFNFMKEHPALDLSGIWSTSLIDVSAMDEQTVKFTFETPDTPIFRYLAHTYIVPQHIWSEIEEPSTFTNPNPVVTGPFLLTRFNPQAVSFQKNDNYWIEGQPYVNQVVYSATKSNDSSLLLLLRKEVDYAHLNIPDPEKSYVEKDPVHNHYWWPVTSANMLFINLTKKPLDDPAFRRALAYATDKEPLSEKAYYNTVPASHPTGIIPTQRAEWLDPDLGDLVYNYNPEKGREILKEAGYSWDSSGALVDPDGKKIPPIRILVGAGWSDFISMAQLLTENYKALGVTLVTEQEPWNSYINSLMGGTYELGICWGEGSDSPYDLFYRGLGSQFGGIDGGQAESNYSRFSSEIVDNALATFRASSDSKVQYEAMATIQREVLSHVPFIPLTDRSNFNVYLTTQFDGWPTAEDPYTGGGAGDTIGARFMLLNLHLKK